MENNELQEYESKVPITFPADTGVKTITPSEKELFVAKAFLHNYGNLPEIKKLFQQQFQQEITVEKIQKILEFDDIKSYIKARVTDLGILNGMTRERWLKEALEYRDGVKPSNKMTAFFHKMIGEFSGYLSDKSTRINIDKQQINFVQANNND